MRLGIVFFSWLMIAGPSIAEDRVLENDLVRVLVAPEKGGAVTSMIHKKAANFPCIKDKRAGVAGTGAFFVPTVRVGTRTFELADTAMTPEASKAEGPDTTLRMRASLDKVAPGLSVERTFRLAKDESGFRWTDTFRNAGPGARDITLGLGARARQKPEHPCLTLRSWFGDAKEWRQVAQKYPGQGGEERSLFEARSRRVFWRLVGQYGVGFLYQVAVPEAPVIMRHHLPPAYPFSAALEWQTTDLKLRAGESLSIESTVLVDEAGREGNNPSDLAASDRILVTADLRAAGKARETLPATATVVSARPRKVRLAISQSYQEGGRTLDKVTLEGADLVLEPGRAKVFAFEVTPPRKGTCHLHVTLLGEKGERLASSSARAVIDGEGLGGEAEAVWKTYLRKMPERSFKGTWAQIGEQFARAGGLRPKEPDPRSAARLAFYKKHFPFYAELLEGAAQELRVAPERLACLDGAGSGPKEACMAMLFRGPDGPILAYTKERGKEDALGGLRYVKMLPSRGYKYQMYTLNDMGFGYGINSAGLATAGVAITCDKATETYARKATEKWKRAGRRVAPMGTHMMLAMCKNVEEAIAFIENPQAPFEFEGNMLLADRAGHAARLESVGIYRQIHRYDGRDKGFFVAVNYPHERKDGHFRPGSEWTWTANALLRERFLWEFAGARKDRISLRDTFAILSTRGTGGMSLDGFNNPAGFYTMTSYIAVPKAGDLWLSHGNPSKVRFYRYTLGDTER